MKKEIWKTIEDFPNYMISNLGRVKRSVGQYCLTEHILKPQKYRKGYLYVGLCDKGQYTHKKIHRLVLEAFVGPAPKGRVCDHINKIRNDNRLKNLRWVTYKENAIGVGPKLNLKKGERWLLLRVIKSDLLSQRDIGTMFKISKTTVSRLKKRYFG